MRTCFTFIFGVFILIIVLYLGSRLLTSLEQFDSVMTLVKKGDFAVLIKLNHEGELALLADDVNE